MLNGRHNHGFTLMELLVVLLLVSLLAGLATPVVSRSIERARESTLKEDLLVIREAIDDYYTDKGMYPVDLDVLLSERYLRKLPKDPVTKKDWLLIFTQNSDGQQGIIDLRSATDDLASDGTKYSEW